MSEVLEIPEKSLSDVYIANHDKGAVTYRLCAVWFHHGTAADCGYCTAVVDCAVSLTTNRLDVELCGLAVHV
jgi:hypothetical protein